MRNKKNPTIAVKFGINEGRQLLYGEVRDKSELRHCDMIPTDHLQCNVRFAGKSIYSNCRFRPGCIIEVCPVRRVSPTALYSKEVRDMAFEVVPGEEYVIPLGYCQYYDVVSKKFPEANCAYEWDAHRRCIIVRAITDISKDTVLVIDVER